MIDEGNGGDLPEDERFDSEAMRSYDAILESFPPLHGPPLAPPLEAALRAAKRCLGAATFLCSLIRASEGLASQTNPADDPLGHGYCAAFLDYLRHVLLDGHSAIMPAIELLSPFAERAAVPMPADPLTGRAANPYIRVTAHETALAFLEHLLSVVWRVAAPDAYRQATEPRAAVAAKWAKFAPALVSGRLLTVWPQLLPLLPPDVRSEWAAACGREAFRVPAEGRAAIGECPRLEQASAADWSFHEEGFAFRGQSHTLVGIGLKILKCLVEGNGAAQPLSVLREAAWGGAAGQRTVASAIDWLRGKLRVALNLPKSHNPIRAAGKAYRLDIPG